MATSQHIRQLLWAPVACRTALFPPSRPLAHRTFAILAPHSRHMSLPRVLQPSFWASMIPKPFKNRSEQAASREWNPMTSYIILGLLVGSQAIQVLWLKQDRGHSLRKAEAKIGLLKEVIERVQRGEDVPVESMLGTGNTESEKEWAEILKDMKDEEVLFQSKKRRKALRQAAAEEAAQAENKKGEEAKITETEDGRVKVESVNGVRFY